MRRLACAAALLAGCFNPTYDNPTCEPGGECPSGMSCVDGVCRGSVDDVDGGDDPDADPTCYHEDDEEGNDDGGEATGLLVEGPVRICGEIADRAPAGGVIDVDRYTIDGGGQPLIARLTIPGGTDYQVIAIAVGESVVTLSGDAGAAVSPISVDVVDVAIQANNPAGLGRTTPYEFTIEPADASKVCAPAGPADFNEARDTVAGGHLENDVIENIYQDSVLLTANPDDVPEDVSALVLHPSDKLLIAGSAANTAVRTDMYKDRDTYQITTGPGTTQLTISLTWPEDTTTPDDNVDLDVVLMTEDLVRVVYGIVVGPSRYEYVVGDVMPSTSYYVTVASWEDAVADKTYELTICADPAP